MSKYTVQDTQSGKTVTFDWTDKTPPTDTDFEEVFASAGLRQPQAQPEQILTRKPFVPPQFSAQSSSTGTQTFNPIPPKQVSTGEGLSKVGGSILNAGLSGIGATVGGPIGGFVGGTLGSLAEQAIGNNIGYNQLDEKQSLASGQTQTKNVNPPINLGEAALQGGVNAIVGKLFPSASRETRLSKRAGVSLEKNTTWNAPPTVNELTRPEDVANVAPYLKEYANTMERIPDKPPRFGTPEGKYPSSGKPFNIEGGRFATRNIAGVLSDIGNNVWSKVETIIGRHPEGRVNVADLVSGIKEKIASNESLTEAEKKSASSWLGQKAALGEIDFPKAQQMVTDLNADLQPFFNKTSVKQAAAERSSADVAARLGLVDALRTDMIGKLESLGEQGLRKLREDYGSIANIRNAYSRNITKAEIADSAPLLQKIQGAPTMKSAASHLLDFLTSKNAMAKRVLPTAGRMNVSVPDASFVEPQIRGMLPSPSVSIGNIKNPSVGSLNVSPNAPIRASRFIQWLPDNTLPENLRMLPERGTVDPIRYPLNAGPEYGGYPVYEPLPYTGEMPPTGNVPLPRRGGKSKMGKRH